MFFETKNHPAYEYPQKVKVAENQFLTIIRSQLIQRNFSDFILQIESNSKIKMNGVELFCYYEKTRIKTQIGKLNSYSVTSSDNGYIIKQSFVCKKLLFIDNCTPSCAYDSIDYIIPYSKISLFDHRTDFINGDSRRDSISILGQKAEWQLKNLICTENGNFAVSPYISSKGHSKTNHLILSTTPPFSPDIEEEAFDITYLLQLALGNFALPACRVIRKGAHILEIYSLNSPNKIPCFWSPLGTYPYSERGRIKQYIEKALPYIGVNKENGYSTWRAILATYATMNMRHVNLQHRLLFSYLLLDSLYNIFVPDEFQEESNTQQQNYNVNELKKDLIDVFSKHGIPRSEKCSNQVINALDKRGQGRTKVPSFDLRVLQLFNYFDCPPPSADDLKHRNDIIHEGKLKIKDTGEQLKLMTRIFNAVTQLLFAILQYKGTVNYVPENNWQVIK